jgi:hypothetical protein
MVRDSGVSPISLAKAITCQQLRSHMGRSRFLATRSTWRFSGNEPVTMRRKFPER